ncbi:MAG: GNAT family N-acetyltransferase [Anaerolineae bacterium]
MTLGTLASADAGAVLKVDNASFPPIWWASLDELNGWFRESRYAYTLLSGDRVIAYLLAGLQQDCGHIFRIAVTPEWQGRGLGKWLMLYTMYQMQTEHVREITLNTQASNNHSRRLYEKLGFKLTGQEVSIYGHELAPSDT